VDPARVAAIDIGVHTLAAVPSHQPGATPFLVPGRPVKAINHWYNKRHARLQAKLPEGVYVSRQLDILTDQRQRQITSSLPLASRRIVEWLVDQRIGTLVIAKNDGWKQAIGLGKRTNQNVVFVPHARLVQMLEYKAALVGMRVIVSEESDTAKCSFLDLEPIGTHEVYAGNQITRGLFRASTGRCLNADSNAAYNILRNVVPTAFGNGIGGVVVHPVRMALSGWPWRMGRMAVLSMSPRTILGTCKQSISFLPAPRSCWLRFLSHISPGSTLCRRRMFYFLRVRRRSRQTRPCPPPTSRRQQRLRATSTITNSNPARTLGPEPLYPSIHRLSQRRLPQRDERHHRSRLVHAHPIR